MAMRGRSVLDFGAVGDGRTDDTAAIQAGINAVYEQGGGSLYFPFTPHGYRLARPAPESVDGRPCRSQLYIPSERSDSLRARNICLEGEMPVRQLNAYQMITGGRWPVTRFEMPLNNVCLISDWPAPEEPDRNARPWSLISILGGHERPFGLQNLTLRNLELRVHLDTDRMYPTASCANCQSASRLIVEHCHFGLSRNVCDAESNLVLRANPCHTAGLIASADQNDHQAFRSVGVQGFRYGFLLGEHVVADYLYAHNCGEAVAFHDSSHLSSIRHLVAQHNRIIVSALREPTFGLQPSRNVYVQFDGIDYEVGTNQPDDYRMEWGVYDPDDRITGEITHHSGYPCAADVFTVCGGRRLRLRRFGDWAT